MWQTILVLIGIWITQWSLLPTYYMFLNIETENTDLERTILSTSFLLSHYIFAVFHHNLTLTNVYFAFIAAFSCCTLFSTNAVQFFLNCFAWSTGLLSLKQFSQKCVIILKLVKTTIAVFNCFCYSVHF